MNDDTFARLVAEEVKNRVNPEQVDFLMLPENWDPWQQALVALLENLDRQLAEIDAQEQRYRENYADLGDQGTRLLVEAMTDTEERRRKIGRFRLHVDKRLNEVLRRIAMSENDADGIEVEADMANFFRMAIQRHRELMLADDTDFDHEDGIDEALWATLEGRWEFPATPA